MYALDLGGLVAVNVTLTLCSHRTAESNETNRKRWPSVNLRWGFKVSPSTRLAALRTFTKWQLRPPNPFANHHPYFQRPDPPRRQCGGWVTHYLSRMLPLLRELVLLLRNFPPFK